MFLDELGGIKVLEKVHKLFYDKMYAHPWMGKFFKDINQEGIEKQQTDFMAQSFGGPTNYVGRMVKPAHKHMYITDEMIDIRQTLLEESLIEAGVSPEHRAKWLKIDGSFRSAIVKKVEECEKRFFTDELLIFENPDRKKAS